MRQVKVGAGPPVQLWSGLSCPHAKASPAEPDANTKAAITSVFPDTICFPCISRR